MKPVSSRVLDWVQVRLGKLFARRKLMGKDRRVFD